MHYPHIEPLEPRIAPASFSIAPVTVTEGNTGKTVAPFTVTLSAAVSTEVTVDFATGDGTATASGLFPDYESAQGTLSFAPGVISKTISVNVLGESIQEGNENFTVVLSNPSGTQTIASGTAVGAINDDGDTLTGISISNAPDVIEGTGVKSSFTVALAAPVAGTVIVTYASGVAADTAKPAPGLFTDYIAKSGTLTFTAGGPLTQTVDVNITNDSYKEATEQFTVTLTGATNAAVSAKPSAVGKILNDGDTTTGFFIDDVKRVEGNADSTLVLKPTLSAPIGTSFTVATQNGTAVAGTDFVATPLTVAAGQVSPDFTVLIKGDRVFEATESFFVNVSGLPADVVLIKDNPFSPTVQATARVYLFNDDVQNLGNQKAQWIDVDGDLVTLTVNKGQVPLSNTDLFTFVPAGTVGGQQLQRLDLSAFGSTFAGASVSITATKQAGFPNATDGKVDVGFIKGTLFDPDELRAVGVDLGNVTVDGDLARITAGDSFATPAILKLDLGSLGARGVTTLVTADATIESKVLGPLVSMVVKGDVNGFLRVIGAEFGVLGSLKIGGSLKGLGTTNLSGAISVSGRLGTATIGNIIGGGGTNSGLIVGSALGNSSLGSITVTGSITGGSADDSGEIQAPKIGNVKVGTIGGGAGARSGYIFSSTSLGNVTIAGDLVGGSDTDSGEVAAQNGIGVVKVGGKIVGAGGTNSGAIRTAGGIVSLSVGGTLAGGASSGSGSIQTNRGIGAVSFGKNAAGDSIIGGAGADSGEVKIGTNLASFTAAGNVKGGTASGSGAIVATGSIGKLVITGSLIGGNSGATFLDKTGYISALRLTSATIGSIVSGTPGAGGLANSGAIRADVIGALTVSGAVTGTAANPVIITASGLSSNLAITSVSILGNTAFAEILAGYNSVTSATNFRGTATSADASIGTVRFGGTVAGTNLVAGAATGADGRFGFNDDVLASGGGVKDVASVISKIASVVFQSPAAIVSNTATFGIVAQYVAAVKVGAANVPLQAGAGNDVSTGPNDPAPGVELKAGSKFRVLELLLPV